MRNRYPYNALMFIIILLCSCGSGRSFFTNYYLKNEKTLTVIEQSYKALYQQRRFSIQFTDHSFKNISLEIITDSIKFIYEFEINDPGLKDTLFKYGLPVNGVRDLIKQMGSIHCMWINNLDYYTNKGKQALIFMSIRNIAIHLPFTYEKYYILTFYPQPQYFNKDGKLLAKRSLRKLRKINDEIFMRINNKVCYTISERFRLLFLTVKC